MKLYYPITVDLYNLYPLPIMPAQEADIGRGALVTLTANSAAVVIEDEAVNVYVKKPDGTKVYADCTVAGNQIQVDFSQQMLMVPGMLEVELQMIDADGNNITTPIFLIQNQVSNIDYAGITSSDEFTALVAAFAEIEELKKTGLKGDAATVEVGTTTTSGPGTQAQVTNSGDVHAAVLDFVIPRGEQGETGPQGAQGIQGIPGEKGDKGDPGESGVTTPISGFVNFSVDGDGNLWVYYADGDTPPDFYYDDETGNLYYETEA